MTRSYKSPFTSCLIISGLAISLVSCRQGPAQSEGKVAMNDETNTNKRQARQVSESFRDYWYAGDAELTTYKLEQARYGEIREGQAVLIYVTEPFLKKAQVKADEHHADNTPVLKLNTTKNFLTGIYPYSIMTSSFYGVQDDQHALKLSLSVQEWCGHVYTQLNNREKFEIESHSYFEKEGDQRVALPKSALEDEIWNKIRINPEDLPVGSFTMLPSLEYIRLSHLPFRAYDVIAKVSITGDLKTYELNYPDLERTVKISFGNDFPYPIEKWSESAKSGFGPNAKMLTSKAIKMKTLKTAYWRQNGNKDVFLRDSLGL